MPLLKNTYAVLPLMLTELAVLRWWLQDPFLAWVAGISIPIFLATIYCDVMSNHYRSKLNNH